MTPDEVSATEFNRMFRGKTIAEVSLVKRGEDSYFQFRFTDGGYMQWHTSLARSGGE